MRSIAFFGLAVASVHAIWPLPTEYKHGNGVLWISRDRVEITYNGPGFQPAPSCGGREPRPSGNKIVDHAIQRTWDTLNNSTFVPWKLRPRLSDFEPHPSHGTHITSLTLRQDGLDPADITKPAGPIDESYQLDVTEDGRVSISATTSVGILYGLTTFTQLFFKSSTGAVYTTLAPVSVTDAPQFWWRGLNVDTSRTFKPLSDLYAMIDALSYNKMNRLHWHITDAQSWPLVNPALPELAEKGVYAADQKYSPEDIRAVQEYGSLLGVEVAMEIDNPGHTASIWFSHPDLIAGFNRQPDWPTYCAEPPCGSLKLNSTAVYDFLDRLFADVLPRIKPLTSYFHLGGDEINKNTYLLDDTVQSNESSVLQPLLQKYMDRNMKHVQSFDMTPLVWEEILLEWNLTLPKETIIQTWESDEAVAKVTQAGYRALAGNYRYWYLDCGKGQWLDFHAENAAGFWPFEDYCQPYHNWRVVYSYDPLHGVAEENRHLVIGGETHIWSEQTDTVNFHQMVWPRTAAAAEILWSGAKDAHGQNRSLIDASPRLAEMRERLVARGIHAEPFQMPFCTQNGTQCAWPANE